MNKNQKQLTYECRIHQVQDYICTHIEQDLRLEKLAKIFDFSPFHFHRIFKLITGETLYDFIQRLRLEKACAMLCSKVEVKIIHIAMSCGFSSSSSFSKAFKKHFEVSPSSYRKNHIQNNSKYGTYYSKNGTLNSNSGKEAVTPVEYISDSNLEELYNRRRKLNVRIEDISQYRIAYMRQIGPYGLSNIQLMQKLKKWAISRDLLNESSIILGIAHDNPELTAPGKCRYDCGIVLSGSYELESEINETILPGGKYAVFAVEHSIEAIAKLWKEIFSVWLPDSGYVMDNKPTFERYQGTEIGIEPDTCEICIPVKKL